MSVIFDSVKSIANRPWPYLLKELSERCKLKQDTTTAPVFESGMVLVCASVLGMHVRLVFRSVPIVLTVSVLEIVFHSLSTALSKGCGLYARV